MNRKFAFTLAEGTPCIDPLQLAAQRAFTLAEVLITLAVIGVVAAMTIPTLVAKINNIVIENQNKVFQAKLIKALNLTKTAGLLNNSYSSTEDFLRSGLAKHYKMSAICGKDDLRSCIPYDKIYFGEENKSVNVADLKTAASIKVTADGFDDTAAFVTMDGIPVIATYKKDCLVDTEMLDKGISSCLAGIYDLNGSKLPNKYGVVMEGETIKAYTNDIHSFNGAGVGSNNKINGVEIVVKAFNPSAPTIYNDADVGAPQYTEGWCADCHDYWIAAQKYCKKNGAKLPTAEQLAKIAQALYNDTSIPTTASSYNINSSLDWSANKTAVFDALGIDSGSSSIRLWSAEPNRDCAYFRSFSSGTTAYNYGGRNGNGMRAVCVK